MVDDTRTLPMDEALELGTDALRIVRELSDDGMKQGELAETCGLEPRVVAILTERLERLGIVHIGKGQLWDKYVVLRYDTVMIRVTE